MIAFSNILGDVRRIFIKFALAVIMAVAASFLLAPYWQKSYAVIHTVLEISCIIISVSSFFVVWCVSEIRKTNLILGFGFLAVAIFDILHTFFWQGLGLFPGSYYDLSAKYWLAGRFAEALFLILSTTSIVKLSIHRWLGLALTIIASSTVAFDFYYTPGIFPVLITPEGVKPLKVAIEYIIISMFILFLFRVQKGHFHEDIITKEYLILATIITIPAELCFTIFTTITDFYNVLGHILKISYYFFFLKAVVAAFIIFPYKKLQISEDRFHKAFHMNPSMMMITTPDGKVVDVNECYAKLVGISRQEIIRQSFFEDNNEKVNWGIRQDSLVGEKLHNDILNCQTVSGESREIMVSTDTILIDNTQFVLVVATDITDKTRLEKEMARYDCLNVVGEIAAGIGHEVRNPMTTVRGYLQIFQRREQFYEYHEQINTMIEELDRANSIITEFLSLAKDKAVEMKRGNLMNVIRSLLPLLKADALRLGHEIYTDINYIPDTEFNENEIRQILLNLVRNAFEAMSESGEVMIHTSYSEGSILLSIRDNGSGIPPEVVRKLGTPFVTTKENGTGLGLPVCYRIAERHNAKIDLVTGPKGTTFKLIFYLA
ncbi:MASE3 domain-containing protein [Dendrosporobacter sp. 1207_IL3150]|uniref:MASE3 domain-containing protein n=1 Tax=Dendrosporobacter sp. 1207_IL3150 TaxID=3084054 RepID=UPI002FDA7CA2